MKAPSFHCRVKPDVKPNVSSTDGIDLTKTHGERRELRKAINKSTKRRTDEVHFVDLPGVADYDAFFSEFIDPKLSMNIKGPLSNNFWSFTAADSVETNQRLVSLKVVSINFYNLSTYILAGSY